MVVGNQITPLLRALNFFLDIFVKEANHLVLLHWFYRRNNLGEVLLTILSWAPPEREMVGIIFFGDYWGISGCLSLLFTGIKLSLDM